MSIHTFIQREEILLQWLIHPVTMYLNTCISILPSFQSIFLTSYKANLSPLCPSLDLLESNMRVFEIQTKPPCPESTKSGGRCSQSNRLFLMPYTKAKGQVTKEVIQGQLLLDLLSPAPSPYFIVSFLASGLKVESYFIDCIF